MFHSFYGWVVFHCVFGCTQSLQSYPTLCNPMDCSSPGSSVHGILQARILQWVAVPSSRGFFTAWAIKEAYIYIYNVCHVIFVHSFVDGHSGCFHILVIVNNAATSIWVLVSFWVSINWCSLIPEVTCDDILISFLVILFLKSPTALKQMYTKIPDLKYFSCLYFESLNLWGKSAWFI